MQSIPKPTKGPSIMECKPATAISMAALAQLFTDCFDGYMGRNISLTAETAAVWAEKHLVQMSRSYIFYDTSISPEPVAFGLIAIREDRPNHTRLAAMGVAKNTQGKGVGSRALEILVEREREAGVKILELECINVNERGLKMYKRAGFEIVDDLLGWETDAQRGDEDKVDGDESQDSLEEVDVDEVHNLVRQHGLRDLAWQPAFPNRLAICARAFRLGHAWCAISEPSKAKDQEGEDKDVVKMGCLIVEPEHRGRGEATRLAKAVMAKLGEDGRKWSAPGYFPKASGERIAEKIGAKRSEKYQYLMRLNL